MSVRAKAVRSRVTSAAVVALLASVVALTAQPATGVAAASGGQGSGQAGSQGTGGRYIVVFDRSVDRPATTARRQGLRHDVKNVDVLSHAVDGYVATMSPEQAHAVGKEGNVRFVVPDQKLQLADVHAPRVPQAWNERVLEPQSSTRSGNAKGAVHVNVAVIDTGIDATHPDLNVRGGVDCTTGGPVAVTPVDPVGHGTFVAGTIGARDNRIGVEGAAPGTPLWSVRVADDSGAIYLSSLVCAVDWVTSTRTDTDPGNDISVANMSLSGVGTDDQNCGLTAQDPLHLAVCNSVAAGVTYSVAAGNENADLADSIPADYNEVLTAAAMADYDGKPGQRVAPSCQGQDYTRYGRDDASATFSNYATTDQDKAHTIAAPGVCMVSTWPGGYYTASGTSAASPVIAGTVALCIQVKRCHDGQPLRNMRRVENRMRHYSLKHRHYGFVGDPQRMIGNRYYGNLVNESVY